MILSDFVWRKHNRATERLQPSSLYLCVPLISLRGTSGWAVSTVLFLFHFSSLFPFFNETFRHSVEPREKISNANKIFTYDRTLRKHFDQFNDSKNDSGTENEGKKDLFHIFRDWFESLIVCGNQKWTHEFHLKEIKDYRWIIYYWIMIRW